MTDVRPVSPAAPYLGGKRNLASRICARLREIPHRTYVEPFVGMGGIFLRRDRRPPVEVVNDLSGDVANLFRLLQRHYVPFMDMLRWQVTSRAEFARLLKQEATSLTDLERAARFLYLQRLSFGGKVRGRNFGVDKRSPARFDVTKLAPALADIHERLAGVVIEQLNYADAIDRYDSGETLFYVDSPYVGCETDYGDGFAPDDFRRLADQLAHVQGRFLLSINDTPLSRDVFGRFRIEEVPTTWTIATKSAGRGKAVTELLISNLP